MHCRALLSTTRGIRIVHWSIILYCLHVKEAPEGDKSEDRFRVTVAIPNYVLADYVETTITLFNDQQIVCFFTRTATFS